MAAMPRKLPPFCLRERTRHGRTVIYFRRGKGARIRLPDDPASPEFNNAYEAALVGREIGPRKSVSSQSLEWLIARYMESAAWARLSAATRKLRGTVFREALKHAGNPPFAGITKRTIQASVERRAKTPGYANNFLTAMRGLFSWAVKNGHMAQNPALGVEGIRYKSDGYPPWDRDDVLAFRLKHPEGTMARLAMELLLVTGLRRSDIVRIGRQHLRGDVLTIRTQKTGTDVSIALPPYMLDLIGQTPAGNLHFVVGKGGNPLTKESFGNWFCNQCRKAGVRKSAHGLRKLSATLAAEGGAPAHQIMAHYGWTNIAQAETYTKKADRARMGVTSSRLVGEQIVNRFAPHPNVGCGENSKNRNKNK